MKAKRHKIFPLFLMLLFSVCAAAQEWQEFESLGYDRNDHPFVKVVKDGKQYYYHLDGRLLVDEIENKGFGMSVVMKDGAYGVVAEDGKLLAPFAYDGIKLEYDYTGQWYEGIPYNYKFIRLQQDGLYGVADSNGHILAEPTYTDLQIISRDIVAVMQDNRWGWLDGETGELLQPCIYEELRKTYAFDDCIEVKQNGRYGIAKKDGNLLIPIASESSLFFPHAEETTYVLGETDGTYILYDSLGNTLLEGDYPVLRAIENSPLLSYQRNGMKGLIDPRTGTLVVEPQFSAVVSCVRGRYIVQKPDGKLGVLTEHGKWLLPPEFNRAEFINAEGRVKLSAQIVDISSFGRSGNPITSEHAAKIAYEAKIDSLPYYIRVYKGTQVGIYDWEGKTLLSTTNESYDGVNLRYYGGKVYFEIVDSQNQWRMCNAAGETILPTGSLRGEHYQYSVKEIETDYDLLKRYVDVVVDKENNDPYALSKYVGLFDLKTGKMVIEPALQSIEWMSKDLFKVIPRGEDHQPVRIYDAEGKMLATLDSNTLDVFLLNNGLLLAEKKEGYNSATMLLMDISGKVLYENPKWTSRGSYGNIRFPENEQWINGYFYGGWKKIYADETNLFVNERGEEKRFADYDQVDGFFGGHALVAKKMTIEDEDAFRFGGDYYHFGLIDSTGREVFPPEWQSVAELGKNPYLLVVRKKGKYGLIDRRGNVILEPVYDYMESSASEPYVQLQKNDKFGLMTAEGRIVIEPHYDRIWESGEGEEKTWPLCVKDGEWYYFVGKDGKPYPIRAKQRD
ncbi:MAG: WG repeat-containing protein [Sphingobacterium sp.]